MRAFVAIPVTAPAHDEGVRLLAELHQALSDVRWVRPDGLHLTLHFFAHLDEKDVAAVVQAMTAAAARHAQFAVQLCGLGCFPRAGDERVLWIGMRDGAAPTAALQGDVEAELDNAGFPREARAFAPHVTLGRPRQRFSDAQRRRWGDFAGTTLPPFTVAEVRLYRSQPGPGGSVYEVLAAAPLRGWI